MPTGNASDNFWEIRRYGEVNSYDGQGGVDTLSFERLSRSDFIITQNTDGSVNVDSVSGASAYYRLRLVNVEFLTFSYGTVRLDLRTAFSVADTVSPQLNSAVVSTDGRSITLTWSETIDPANLPALAAFTVSVSGQDYRPDSLTASGTTVILGLPAEATVLAGQTVLLSYTDPTAGNDALALQDRAGNDAATLANRAVTNESTRTPTPVPGTDGSERLTGSAGADSISAGAGADTLVGLGGNDTLEGGAGLDMAVYSGARSSATITRGSDDVIFVSGPEGVDRLTGVERLSFSDKTLALDIDGIGGKTYRLYKAAYDRAPDAGGLGFWMHYLDNGFDMLEAANNFLNSAEFRQLYDDDPNTAGYQEPSIERFVTKVYRHALQREPEGAGYQFWVDAMYNKDGAFGKAYSRGEVLIAFSESAENRANVIGSIINGFEYKPFNPMPG